MPLFIKSFICVKYSDWIGLVQLPLTTTVNLSKIYGLQYDYQTTTIDGGAKLYILRMKKE